MAILDLRERLYVSQYAQDVLTLDVRVAGQPADVDGDAVTVEFILQGDEFATPTPPDTTVFTRAAVRVDLGLYETQLTSGDSQTPGNYRVHWTYAIDAVDQVYDSYVVIGAAAPTYDNLDAAMKTLVDSVWVRFADLFDSPDGGPNLQTYFQTHYGRGRIAQLLRIAVGRLNTIAQPHSTYTIDVPGQFPVAQWGPLLEEALYVECIKHLVRSYVEQPQFVGGSVTRFDRRDYMDRWQSVLEMEQADLKAELDVFKIANMGLGRPRALVSGGVFGRYGPTRFAGSVAARPRYWTRFYTILLLAVMVVSGVCRASASSESHHPQNSSLHGFGHGSISQGA